MLQTKPEPYLFYELPTRSLNDERCSRIGADLLHPATVAARYGLGLLDLDQIDGIKIARIELNYWGGAQLPTDLYSRRDLARWEATSMVDDLAEWSAKTIWHVEL
jgi:hypothetical protein